MTRHRKPLARRLAAGLAVCVLRWIGPLFFDRRYLRGRHFSETRAGWAWVLRSIFTQKIAGFGRNVPWPVSPFINVSEPDGIVFHPDDLNNFQTMGTYFSNNGGGVIRIGRGAYIAPNVGLITTNHDPLAPDAHLPPRDITIGEKCWVGMNSVILPGVTLGDHTVVGAGSVVSKSFPEGYCVVAGSPAVKIRELPQPMPADAIHTAPGDRSQPPWAA
ncbi:MAG: acyltransferase [Chloroflexi bacterium]|nr:acyltransferase [Chloroflexota bacterium]